MVRWDFFNAFSALEGEHFLNKRTAFRPSRRGCRVVLVATMRNEGRFILEWVAYHLVAGFTDLVIGTNDCVGKSPRLLERFQALGPVIRVVNNVGGLRCRKVPM